MLIRKINNPDALNPRIRSNNFDCVFSVGRDLIVGPKIPTFVPAASSWRAFISRLGFISMVKQHRDFNRCIYFASVCTIEYKPCWVIMRAGAMACDPRAINIPGVFGIAPLGCILWRRTCVLFQMHLNAFSILKRLQLRRFGLVSGPFFTRFIASRKTPKFEAKLSPDF